MTQKRLSLQFILLVLVLGGFFFVLDPKPLPSGLRSTVATSSQVSAGAVTTIASTTTSVATTTATTTIITKPEQKPVETKKPVTTPPVTTAPAASTAQDDDVARIENPYATPPLSFVDVNITARAAVVNILCMPKNGGMSPISGSGVIVSPRGVILTNAHVAQYVLLAQSGKVDLGCFIRTGSPATIRWIPRVMYIPSVWIHEHAADILAQHPTGTGEHDYALLYIARSYDTNPLPTTFPYVLPDSREAIGFVDDEVLAASYPAEFLGASAGLNLYPASSVTTIGQLLTFTTKSVDVISVGGVIEAQSGSSGGAIVNAWNKLIGIITTTSEGATTSERDLRAITTSYIDRDISLQTGRDLATWLAGNPASQTADFAAHSATALSDLLYNQIFKN